MTSGCFALFELDGYGPAEPVDEAGAMDAAADAADAARDAGPPPKVVFVTSQLFAIAEENGITTDPAVAHGHCNALARDAGLTGEYKAWISKEGSSPSTEFEALTSDGGDRYPLVTTNGMLIASSYAQLADSGPRAPIAVTETRQSLADAAAEEGCESPFVVWSATDGAGKHVEGRDCASWRTRATQAPGRVGRLVAAPEEWTSACDLPCSRMARLYCFQQ